MAKFISVLNPNSPAPFWTAVQWADTLEALRANHQYTAGVNLTVIKNDGDYKEPITVQIVEVITQQPVHATIIHLSPANVNFVRLAAGKPSKRFLKTLKKIGGADEK